MSWHVGVNACTFDNTSSFLITGAEDNRVRMWDVNTGELRKTFPLVHTSTPRHCECGRKTNSLLVVDSETIRVWNINSKENLLTLSKPQQALQSTEHFGCFSQDESLILQCANTDCGIWLVNGADHSFAAASVLIHGTAVTKCAINADNSRVATISDCVMVWDTETSTPLFTSQRSRTSVCLSGDGSMLVYLVQGAVVIQDVRCANAVTRINAAADIVQLSTNDRSVLFVTNQDVIQRVDLSSTQTKAFVGQARSVRDCCESADGKYIASCSRMYCSTILWDTYSCRKLRKLTGHAAFAPVPPDQAS